MGLNRWVGALAVGAAVAIVHHRWTGPGLRRLGAVEPEIAAGLPGDEIVDDPVSVTTMAVSLDAAPTEVWPWLAQMGCDRAGWYSWDRIDNAGRPSADRIIPEWQHLGVGDRMQSNAAGSSWFAVAGVESPHLLVLRADERWPMGGPFEPGEDRPPRYLTVSWSFLLRELPPGRTRLVVRSRVGGSPRSLLALASVLVWEPGHAIMQLRQFAGLRRRLRRP